MAILEVYRKQFEIAKKKFGYIVEKGEILYMESGEPLKLRLNIIDGSIVDVFCSVKGKYSYHWERRMINGSIYRHDNAPHKQWRNIKTFPKHFHKGFEERGEESHINDNPYTVLKSRKMFRWVRIALYIQILQLTIKKAK